MTSNLMQQEERLLDFLARHGANGPRVAALDAWQAFKDFGRSIQLDDGTGLLFQVGTYDFDGPALFHLGCVVQFESVDADGEHEGFEQLHCELTCPPAPQLDGVTAELWSFEHPDADAWYTAVEAMPEFDIAMRQGRYRLRVYGEAV